MIVLWSIQDDEVTVWKFVGLWPNRSTFIFSFSHLPEAGVQTIWNQSNLICKMGSIMSALQGEFVRIKCKITRTASRSIRIHTQDFSISHIDSEARRQDKACTNLNDFLKQQGTAWDYSVLDYLNNSQIAPWMANEPSKHHCFRSSYLIFKLL